LACKLATAKIKSSDVVTSKQIASKEGALSGDQYEPGDNIATDQSIIKPAGRLYHHGSKCGLPLGHNP
jgi:hypothetical protein